MDDVHVGGQMDTGDALAEVAADAVVPETGSNSSVVELPIDPVTDDVADAVNRIVSLPSSPNWVSTTVTQDTVAVEAATATDPPPVTTNDTNRSKTNDNRSNGTDDAEVTHNQLRESLEQRLMQLDASRATAREELADYVDSVRSRTDTEGTLSFTFPSNFDKMVSTMGKDDLYVGTPMEKPNTSQWMKALVQDAMERQHAFGVMKDELDDHQRMQRGMARIEHLDRLLQTKTRDAKQVADQTNALISDNHNNNSSSSCIDNMAAVAESDRPSTSSSSVSHQAQGVFITEKRMKERTHKGRLTEDLPAARTSSRRSSRGAVHDSNKSVDVVGRNKKLAEKGANARHTRLTEEEEQRIEMLMNVDLDTWTYPTYETDGDGDGGITVVVGGMRGYEPDPEQLERVDDIDSKLSELLQRRAAWPGGDSAVATTSAQAIVNESARATPTTVLAKPHDSNFLAQERQNRQEREHERRLDIALASLRSAEVSVVRDGVGSVGVGDGVHAGVVLVSEISAITKEATQDLVQHGDAVASKSDLNKVQNYLLVRFCCVFAPS